jgi:hypothetical protein
VGSQSTGTRTALLEVDGLSVQFPAGDGGVAMAADRVDLRVDEVMRPCPSWTIVAAGRTSSSRPDLMTLPGADAHRRGRQIAGL